MKQKTTKIFLLIVMVIMGLGVLGCCGNNGIPFNLSFSARETFGYKEMGEGIRTGLLEIVGSRQELEKLAIEWNNSAFNGDNNQPNSDLSIKLRSYDKQFFSENRLVIYSFERGHSRETRIERLVVNETELIIHARQANIRGTFIDIAFAWTMLIEVPLQYIENATTVSITYR